MRRPTLAELVREAFARAKQPLTVRELAERLSTPERRVTPQACRYHVAALAHAGEIVADGAAWRVAANQRRAGRSIA